MSNNQLRKIILAAGFFISFLGTAYAVNSQITVNATVDGGTAIYCGSTNPNPGSCGTVNFGTFPGASNTQTLVATVTTNNPNDNATLTVADSVANGSPYSLKNTTDATQTIPLAIQYTDCSGNNYGSTSINTPINGVTITGDSISGSTPACTNYNGANPGGTSGKFTFTAYTINNTLPQDGSYTELLNVTIGSS